MSVCMYGASFLFWVSALLGEQRCPRESMTAGSCDGGASPLARRVVAGRGERNGAFRGTLTIVMRAPWKTVTPLLQTDYIFVAYVRFAAVSYTHLTLPTKA